MCDIEIRKMSFEDAKTIAEEYLEKHKDSEKADLAKDYYSPFNPKGYWNNGDIAIDKANNYQWVK